jgi:hypothetical protein
MLHAGYVVGHATLARARDDVLVSQNVQPECQGVSASSVGQFIDEAVEDPGKHVAAGCAPGSHWDPALNRRLLQQAVRCPAARKLVTTEDGPGARLQRLLAVTYNGIRKGDEVVVPGNQLALCVDPAAQVVKAAGTVVIVSQIILSRPG